MRSIKLKFLVATLFLLPLLGACQAGDETPTDAENGTEATAEVLGQELDETEVAEELTELPPTTTTPTVIETRTPTPTASPTTTSTTTPLAPATETMTPTATVTSTLTMTPTVTAMATAQETPQPDPTAVAEGQDVFLSLGCSTCHPGGSAGTGPSLIGLIGSEVMLRSGETVIADEEYVRRSILDPNAEIVAGYQPIMPSFEDQLSSEELDQLIAYIRSLSESE